MQEDNDEQARTVDGLISSRLLYDFANWVKQDHIRRESNRGDLEARWDEVDLQVAMMTEPRVTEDNRTVDESDWLPELDLPLQAQALEVLGTDFANLLFGDGAKWYKVHGALTDKYLERFQEKPGIIGGETVGIPSRLTQSGVDTITRATLDHFHRGYNFRDRWKIFAAECFKYGTGAIRGILARLDLQDDNTYGDKPGMRSPVAVPVSIRQLYLDDSTMHATHEGHVLRPGHIRSFWMKLVDLKLAGKLGADKLGWIPETIERLQPRQDATRDTDHQNAQRDADSVHLLEWEGDLTHVTGETSIYAPNLIITVAVGAADPAVVRVRENPMPFCSYTIGHYLRDNPASPYGVGPLMKGVPLQKAGSAGLNDYMQASALRARPPVTYNPHDPWIAKMGAPKMEPGATWAALTAPTAIEVGDPQPLMNGVEVLVKQHQDFTGVNSVRLGASTQTHKSAYAVNQETIRGQIRTVEFVRSLTEGAVLEWLNKEFLMAKMALKGERRLIWIDDYKGFVEIDADHLPDVAVFEVIGATGPAEEAQENQLFLAVAKSLVEIEPTARQLGAKPLDLDKIRAEALRRTDVEDVASYFKAAPAAVAAPAGAPGVPAATPGQPAIPGAPALAQGGQGPPSAVVPIRR